MFVEWASRGKPSVLGIVSGAVSGLVGITPASGYVNPGDALIIGVVCGILSFLAASKLKNLLKYDDSLDAFGVHAVSGAAGALLTGVFARAEIGNGGRGTAGLLEGNPAQFLLQAEGVIVTALYSAAVTYILLKIVDAVVGLRVDAEIEREGLDLAEHGETIP
jgi:Amt family ammonium transporter